jgi:hypothetical protein
MTAFG